MKTKIMIIEWVAAAAAILGLCAAFVYRVDPYFHYHKPDLEDYYYSLNNQRSQNDGISKYFDYDALITGTSMTENFKTSEMDEIFGTHSIKVAFSGGSYKEINDNLAVALQHNSDLKTVVRCLDYKRILDDKDLMRSDMGNYPTYLYDTNPFNDVEYLLNKDVIFGRVYSMARENDDPGAPRGLTSFDDYSRWQYNFTFGIDTVVPGRDMSSNKGTTIVLTDEEKNTIHGNISQNVTSLADEYPEVDFYYFFSPCSIAYWAEAVNSGTLDKQIDAEKYIIELIVEHPNIHLYSFNNMYDITADLNNYKDAYHYGQWINSMILKWMKDGTGLLTKDNYESYIEDERRFYTDFDYEDANSQVDYEADFHSAALLNKDMWGVDPIELSSGDIDAGITIPEVGKHRYIEFYGRKESANGQPAVFVYDSSNNLAASLSLNSSDPDGEWHQYVLELPELEGQITIIFSGGNTDDTGAADSSYSFSNMTLY